MNGDGDMEVEWGSAKETERWVYNPTHNNLEFDDLEFDTPTPAAYAERIQK